MPTKRDAGAGFDYRLAEVVYLEERGRGARLTFPSGEAAAERIGFEHEFDPAGGCHRRSLIACFP